VVGVPVAVHLVLCPLAYAVELVVIGQVQRAALCIHSISGNESVVRFSQHSLQASVTPSAPEVQWKTADASSFYVSAQLIYLSLERFMMLSQQG